MIDDKRVIAFIPARGGSKGIKKKNIIDLEGKPLIAYTIDAALNCKYIDNVYVSTDSEEIADIAREYGAEVPFLRPAELASDTAKTVDTVCDFISEMKRRENTFDVVVLLQPTSPLRTSDDIEGAIELYCQNDFQSVVSVSETSDNPVLMRRIDKNGKMHKILDISSTVRRQDMDIVYRVNGSIYINSTNEINQETSFNDNLFPYVMRKENSVDIDDYVDLAVAKFYLAERSIK